MKQSSQIIDIVTILTTILVLNTLLKIWIHCIKSGLLFKFCLQIYHVLISHLFWILLVLVMISCLYTCTIIIFVSVSVWYLVQYNFICWCIVCVVLFVYLNVWRHTFTYYNLCLFTMRIWGFVSHICVYLHLNCFSLVIHINKVYHSQFIELLIFFFHIYCGI